MNLNWFGFVHVPFTGNLYTIGGYVMGSGGYTNKVHIHDFKTGLWRASGYSFFEEAYMVIRANNTGLAANSANFFEMYLADGMDDGSAFVCCRRSGGQGQPTLPVSFYYINIEH